MIVTKNTELQRILDHYNPDVPNKTANPKIGIDSAIELFAEWCHYEGLSFTKNSYGYIVDMENTVIRPDFVINDKYFVHIIFSYKENVHLRAYTNFKNRYGKIIVIPKDVVPEFIVLADAKYFFERFATE